MKLSEQERQHRLEVRKRMARRRKLLAGRDRHAFFRDLAERASSKAHMDKVKFLKWCLGACYHVGIRPNLREIKGIFKEIKSTALPMTPTVIKALPFERRKRDNFAKLWDEALEKAKYSEVKPREVERIKNRALRLKIRLEVEEELRDQLRREMGIQPETRIIPEDVRFEVWRRDEGKCAKCGSQKGLEFDHIIPFSKGGSNTARNIQLLCEACNRSKGDTI